MVKKIVVDRGSISYPYKTCLSVFSPFLFQLLDQLYQLLQANITAPNQLLSITNEICAKLTLKASC